MNYDDPNDNEHLNVDAEKRLQVIKTGKSRTAMAFDQAREIEAWMNATDMPTSRFVKWRNLVDTLRVLAQEVRRKREKIEHLAWDLEFAQKRNKMLQAELDEIKANFYQPRQ